MATPSSTFHGAACVPADAAAARPPQRPDDRGNAVAAPRPELNTASSKPRPKLLLLVGTEEELFLPPPVPTGDQLRLRLERRLAIACAVGVR